jgi:hypothetical protein
MIEKDMDKTIIKYFNGYFSYPEVPIDDRRIDWIFLNEVSEIIAVELKLKNWKRVLRQAMLNRFCSNKSYAAIWYEYAKNVKLDWFEKSGIGLLLVFEDRVEEVVEPKSYLIDELTESMQIIRANIENKGDYGVCDNAKKN